MFQHLSWHSPALAPVAVGVSLLIVAVVMGIYWRPMRTLRGAGRWVLPSLRGVALVLVAISIVRPVIVRPRSASERGAIVLLIDRSRSMGIVDSSRKPAELVALADGLAMLPKGIRPKSSAKLEEAPDLQTELVNDLYLARGQLDYARIAGQNTDKAEKQLADIAARADKLTTRLEDYPKAQGLADELAALARETDTPAEQWTRQVAALNLSLAGAITEAQTSADNALYRANDPVRQACDELASLSRLGIVERALTSPQGGVLSRLLRQSAVFGFAFADDVVPVPLEDQNKSLKTLAVEPGGLKSDLGSALRAVRQVMAGQPVQAIVLFSDGRQIGGPDVAQVLPTIAPPVFAIDVAGPAGKDLAMTRLVAPASAFMGQTATIRADLRGTGIGDTPIDVQLDLDGKRQTKRIKVEENQVATAEFSVRFEHPGEQTISLAIANLPGEITVENNRVGKRITVLADKVKVLAVTGWPGWEYQTIRAALSSSPFIELREQIISADAPKVADAPDAIAQQDVVLLSDIGADALSPEQWTAIGKLVRERGGSVIVIPGDAKNLVDMSQRPGAADLLPFNDPQEAAWRVWPGQEPYFHLAIAPGEDDSDALRLADAPAVNARRWNTLSGIYRFMPVAEARPGTRTLLIEPDSELPVLTQRRVGAGRAFFFGVRETWRWRSKTGGDQERFWLQLLRFAARQRESAADAQITQEPLAELANVAGDVQRLRRIATATGGEMLKIDEIAALPDKIREAGEKLPGFFEYPIWDSGYLFALVVGCLGMEWALRKRAGLI